jgi:hypothetical protein
MAATSAFRSDDARDSYLQLYDAALSISTIPVTESDIETSFGRTHVLHAGDPSKPPLVALHGSSVSSTSWVPLLPILTATHTVASTARSQHVSRPHATVVNARQRR